MKQWSKVIREMSKRGLRSMFLVESSVALASLHDLLWVFFFFFINIYIFFHKRFEEEEGAKEIEDEEATFMGVWVGAISGCNSEHNIIIINKTEGEGP